MARAVWPEPKMTVGIPHQDLPEQTWRAADLQMTISMAVAANAKHNAASIRHGLLCRIRIAPAARPLPRADPARIFLNSCAGLIPHPGYSPKPAKIRSIDVSAKTNSFHNSGHPR